MKTTSSVCGKPGGLRRRITSVLLTLSLALAIVTATPRPAAAATSVRGCFAYGGGYGYASALWDMPVELLAYHIEGNYWFVIGRTTLSSAGCAYFTLTGAYTGVFLLMRVEHPSHNGITSGVYSGVTPGFAYPGEGHAELGRGQVNFIPRY